MAGEKKSKTTEQILKEVEKAQAKENYRKSPEGIRKSNNKKLLKESGEKVEDLQKLADRLEKQREGTFLRIATDPEKVDEDTKRRYDEIYILIEKINDSCEKANDLIASYRQNAENKETQTNINALNDHIETLQNNLTKIIQPNFLANLSDWLLGGNPGAQDKFGRTLLSLGALVIGILALGLGFAGGGFLIPPGVGLITVGAVGLGIVGFNEIMGESYFGELALNNADNNSDYTALTDAIYGINAIHKATVPPKNLESSESLNLEEPLVVDVHGQSYGKNKVFKEPESPQETVVNPTPASTPSPKLTLSSDDTDTKK